MKHKLFFYSLYIEEPIHGKELYKRVIEQGTKIKQQSLMVALGREDDVEKTAPNTWRLVDDTNIE